MYVQNLPYIRGQNDDSMTKVDVLVIDDTQSNAFVILAHGEYVHVRLEATRRYRWLKISVRSERLYRMFRYYLRKMGNEINIMYRTYAGEVNLPNIPKLLRSTTDKGWRHFSLRLPDMTG